MKFKITCSSAGGLPDTENKEKLIKEYPFLLGYNFESNKEGEFILIESLEDLLQLQKLACSSCGEAWGLVLLPEREDSPAEIEIYDDYRE